MTKEANLTFKGKGDAFRSSLWVDDSSEWWEFMFSSVLSAGGHTALSTLVHTLLSSRQ